ncbi:Thymidine phosphorylase [Neorhodopirellula pilleata]|uniref:thymidine phosphorylase n=2 Tax=Neorhodopirellula pilleata TaxID=2714738 RepID=A0A5C6ATX6_9BACT|nr:Thymidine phosphorylase [Neorhodopirellula pilleata]
MLCTHLIRQKRDAGELTKDQWEFLIRGFCDGSVSPAQMAAMAMAICIRGLNSRETVDLTATMLASGTRLPRVTDRPRVDKHSTGGLGDKVSLVLAPLLAAVGCDVPMISGRGLGRTGGTLDKLEAIEGFETSLSIDQSSDVLRRVGAFIIGADESIAPADRKLYALRDVTATVESVGLITASILSKKLAASLDALTMDVKVGRGGFMPDVEQARELAGRLVEVAAGSHLPTNAILSDMNQPLGEAIGNAIEVNEAIQILRGGTCNERVARVRDLTIRLAAQSLIAVDLAGGLEEAQQMLTRALDQGDAMERFERMITAQHGRLPTSGILSLESRREWGAPVAGWVSRIDCEAIGDAIILAGGGRRRGGETLNHRVGIELMVQIGQRVEQGQPIIALHDDKNAMTPDPTTWVTIEEAPKPMAHLIVEVI